MHRDNILNFRIPIISKEERKQKKLGIRLHFFLKNGKMLSYVKAEWWSHGCQLHEVFCMAEILHN